MKRRSPHNIDARKFATRPVPCRMCARGKMFRRLKELDAQGRHVYRCDKCDYVQHWSNGSHAVRKVGIQIALT